MAASTEQKKILLRGILYAAQDASATLLATLKAAFKDRYSEVKDGRLIVSTSANGHTATFQIPQGMTAEDVALALDELLELYDTAKTELGGTPTDTQIYNTMRLYLVPAREAYSDFSALRTIEGSAP